MAFACITIHGIWLSAWMRVSPVWAQAQYLGHAPIVRAVWWTRSPQRKQAKCLRRLHARTYTHTATARFSLRIIKSRSFSGNDANRSCRRTVNGKMEREQDKRNKQDLGRNLQINSCRHIHLTHPATAQMRSEHVNYGFNVQNTIPCLNIWEFEIYLYVCSSSSKFHVQANVWYIIYNMVPMPLYIIM